MEGKFKYYVQRLVGIEIVFPEDLIRMKEERKNKENDDKSLNDR